jgi:2-polyprenyl-3-methyl-5-hydroxy-6-metoxy-1,4-benzoquinol methylase
MSRIRRIRRILKMSNQERISKVKAKVHNVISPKRNLRRLAYKLDCLSLAGNEGFYVEREEYGPVNLHTKLQRQAAGGPFEPRDITLVNKLAVKLAGSPNRVLEVGSGTGMFSSMLADRESNVKIIASEFQDETRQWAIENRSRSNVEFCKRPFSDFETDQFDLCVALEVIEHISDFSEFLQEMSLMSPRAIISTPNKLRSAFDSVVNTPEFDQHVREWTCGEFYWVLRAYWDDVEIHTIPNISRQMSLLAANDNYAPTSKLTGVHGREHCMVAVCESPRRNFQKTAA